MSNEFVQIGLKDFIKSTLLDINHAVAEAKGEGLPIAYCEYKSGNHPSVKTIEFDIAIQVSKNDESGKGNNFGVGISVVNLNFSKDKVKSSHHETSNRIKFSVDMFLGMENPNSEG